MREDFCRSLFIVAGFDVRRMHRLENQYWPSVPEYDRLRLDNPWWLVKTSLGDVTIGRRKRVWSIDWSDTGYRFSDDEPITADDLTKGPHFVHAYTVPKMVEYLLELRYRLWLRATEATEAAAAQPQSEGGR